MIHDGVKLHNVESLTDQNGGVRLDRLPRDVRETLNENAQIMYTHAAGCEVRFVADGPVSVTLSSPGECQVTPCYGSFLSPPDERVTLGDESTTIELDVPDQLNSLDPKLVDKMPFDPSVHRVTLYGGPAILHGIEGDVRPPEPAELPDRRYLVYGTSITQGIAATDRHLTYAGQTARRLGADLVNLGTSGSAYCEPDLAEYVAARDDWDLATLSISVNMLGSGFPAAEFRERAAYMIDTIANAHPDAPVACITLFPVFPDLRREKSVPESWKSTSEEYRATLRSVVAETSAPNVFLIEGPELLADSTGLAPDLVHPTDVGMVEIGERLARRLTPLLK
ncbi:GDSL-type esterase/lipase family protein [Halobacteria archaeon AArc-m2/3/4]|uniref:GDSL-type esterase/lipase family protein n=1 Tax=Natronoglomus mannanivorans TaxID=2979990 RepID=A0ABT2QKK8_9EURY|nr:GDSL-type esterase/lipase family protein [Halobacteria archaeon AArc-m2/3/4]